MSISHLIETYGYLAVFLLVGAESLGIPLPGETALILAGTAETGGSVALPTASLKINCSRQPAEGDQPQFTQWSQA
jgi:membrane protein DedA with SNARE-associated domain